MRESIPTKDQAKHAYPFPFHKKTELVSHNLDETLPFKDDQIKQLASEKEITTEMKKTLTSIVVQGRDEKQEIENMVNAKEELVKRLKGIYNDKKLDMYKYVDSDRIGNALKKKHIEVIAYNIMQDLKHIFE